MFGPKIKKCVHVLFKYCFLNVIARHENQRGPLLKKTINCHHSKNAQNPNCKQGAQKVYSDMEVSNVWIIENLRVNH